MLDPRAFGPTSSPRPLTGLARLGRFRPPALDGGDRMFANPGMPRGPQGDDRMYANPGMPRGVDDRMFANPGMPKRPLDSPASPTPWPRNPLDDRMFANPGMRRYARPDMPDDELWRPLKPGAPDDRMFANPGMPRGPQPPDFVAGPVFPPSGLLGLESLTGGDLSSRLRRVR